MRAIGSQCSPGRKPSLVELEKCRRPSSIMAHPIGGDNMGNLVQDRDLAWRLVAAEVQLHRVGVVHAEEFAAILPRVCMPVQLQNHLICTLFCDDLARPTDVRFPVGTGESRHVKRHVAVDGMHHRPPIDSDYDRIPA